MASSDEKRRIMTKDPFAILPKIIFILFTKLFVIAAGGALHAGEPVCCERQFLFKIERTRDDDEVYYDVNLHADGSLHLENPVSVYWVRHTADGRHEPLTWMQKRYAYGVDILERAKDRVVFQFVSYNKMTFVVQRDRNDAFQVYTANGYQSQVMGIRVFFEPGTLLIPSIEKVELHTKHAGTGSLMVQAIRP
jgi:hypothetical protein